MCIGLPPASEIRRGRLQWVKELGCQGSDHGKCWVSCSFGQAEDVSVQLIDGSFCENAVGRGSVGEA